MSRNATGSPELSVDSYCTFAQIEPYIPRRSINSSSKPTKAQALHLVRGTYQEINALLAVLGYHVPVASSNGTAIATLARLNALGAAAEIEAAAYSAGNSNRSEHSDQLRDMYKALYVKLEKGELVLIGAEMEPNYMKRRNERAGTYEFDHNDEGNERDPTFTTSMDW